MYSAARNARRLRSESARPALSSIGLLFSAFCLGGLFLARVVDRGGLGLAGGVVALDRIARGVEHGGDLAAGGGEFGLGLGLALDRGVDDRAPLLLVLGVGFALESLELFDQAWRALAYSVSAF